MTTGPVNTRHVDMAAVAASLRDVWPSLPWHAARFGHGAFHGVVELPDVVVRIAFGNDHRQRTVAEAENCRRFRALPHGITVPDVLLDPVSTSAWTAVAQTRVRGRPLTDAAWSEARSVYLPLLDRLRSVSTSDASAQALRPVRAWCGGPRWPELVEELFGRMPSATVRRRASDVVGRLLDAEADAPVGVVHGDLNGFNVLVGPAGTALIDVDHAAVGDYAIDCSWLVRAFPIEELRRDLSHDILSRARLHLAAGSLQVAAAAFVIGDEALLLHALENFAARSGTADGA